MKRKNQEKLEIEKEWKICKRNTPALAERLEKEREIWFDNIKKKINKDNFFEVKAEAVGECSCNLFRNDVRFFFEHIKNNDNYKIIVCNKNK